MSTVRLVRACLGDSVPDELRDRLDRYAALLLEENHRVNLTAARTVEHVWSQHILDSLSLLPLIEQVRPTTLLDLGSGGGLPGIPLACAAPEVQVTLLDSTQKKIEACERIVRGLGICNVRAARDRAETLAHDPEWRETFDVVVSRAVAELRALCELAAGFVRVGGFCWFMKTSDALPTERAEAESAAAACSLAFARTYEYALPAVRQKRLVAIYRKTGPLHERLPRPPGRAKKRPL